MKTRLLLTISLFLALSHAIAATDSALPPTTQIQGCGSTLPTLDTPIVANIVAGATSYRFRVSTILPTAIAPLQIYTSNTRTFKLTQLANFGFERTYSIDVAVFHNGAWQEYGPSCTISSPTPITQIQGISCGLTMGSITDPIYANAVPYAQGYRFRVTNLADPSDVHIIDRNTREFRLNNFPVSSGATYLVEVAIKNFDGTYFPFGATCSITCPVLYTKIMASLCGRTLNTLSDYLYADLVSGALGYRFKITTMTNTSEVQILDRPVRYFQMTMLPSVQYNTPYKIEVSVKDPSGTYLPFGPFCTIFTTIVPAPKIQLSQCELVGPSLSELMYADDYPNATHYRFKLENVQLGYSQYITRTQRCYSLNMFSGLQPNTAYTVRVSVKLDGVFTSYGKPCDVTTPSMPTRMDEGNVHEIAFSPAIYPNPYADYFSIDAVSSADAIEVKLYDMTGRLLESHRTTGEELPNLQLGQDFPPGVYNVIMTEGEEAISRRVIKR